MVDIVESLISLGVIVGFGFLIWTRIVVKYPQFKDWFKKKDTPKIDTGRETKNQIWTENRSMM